MSGSRLSLSSRATSFHVVTPPLQIIRFDLPNDASVALHRAAGFTAVGVYRYAGYKLGAWHDVGWYERAIAEAANPPEEPIPLPELPPEALARALGD